MSTLIEPIHNLALDLLNDIKQVREGKLSASKAKITSDLSGKAIKAISIALVETKQIELQEKKLVIRSKELIFKEKELEYKMDKV